MRLPRECHRMKQVIETHLPHLTQPQLTGLAWWVCGAILAGSACQNAVAAAPSTRSNWNNLRQYLREWLYDGSDRARPCRTDLDVSLCFVPLLRWVLAWWRNRPAGPGGGPHVEKGRHRRHRHQRALPGLRHSRGLAHPPGQPAGVLDGPDSGTAGGTGAGGGRGNDRGGAVRPGPGQSEIVETDTRSRLASLHEVCEKRHLLRRGRSKAASPRLRPTSRYRRDRQGNRLQQRRSSETPLHPAGGLVRGTGGVVDYPDRPSPGPGRGESVRAAILDRVGVQVPQGLGWQWQQTRRPGPTRISRHWLVLSVATLLALAYGTRVEDAYDRRMAPGSLRAPPRALVNTWRPLTAVAHSRRYEPSA